MVEGGVGLPLLVACNPLAGSIGDDVGGVPLAVVLVDRHDPVAVVVTFEEAQGLGIVEGQEAVAVGHEKLRLQQLERGADGPGGPEELRTLVGPADTHAVPRPVAHVGLDLLGEVRHAHDDVPDPAAGLPATSSMDLGIVSVCGRIRVASPPARTTACLNKGWPF